MAQDAERALVSKVIQTQQAESVIARGIEPEHFADKECQAVYETIRQHVRRYKTPPSLDAVRETHPDFAVVVSSDSLEFLTDRLVKRIKYRQAAELGRGFMASIDDPDQVGDIEVVALEMARTLTEVVPSPSISRYSDMPSRIDEYRRRKEEGDILGIQTGFPTIDRLTFGFQPHEFITIAAFLGIGKSTLLQRIFFEAYLQDKTPMMFSLEMEAEALMRKWDTMATQVQYNAMKALELPDADVEKWEKVGEKAAMAKGDKDIIVIDNPKAGTPDRIYAETVRYKPDIVGVDYIQMMPAPRGISGSMWEKVTHLSRELKYNARSLKVPVVAAAQGNREAAKEGVSLDTIGNAISIAQDSDICFGLHQDEDDKVNSMMQIRMLKNRDGKKKNLTARWDLDTMDIEEMDANPFTDEREKEETDD